MKKETAKWVTFIGDTSMEEAIDEFFDEDWNPRSWKDTEANINSYIEEFQEISDEEISLLRIEIKKEFDKRVNELRQEEAVRLKDRKSILNWINNLIDWPNYGEVGYILSKEEILDLILQNGNK